MFNFKLNSHQHSGKTKISIENNLKSGILWWKTWQSCAYIIFYHHRSKKPLTPVAHWQIQRESLSKQKAPVLCLVFLDPEQPPHVCNERRVEKYKFCPSRGNVLIHMWSSWFQRAALILSSVQESWPPTDLCGQWTYNFLYFLSQRAQVGRNAKSISAVSRSLLCQIYQQTSPNLSSSWAGVKGVCDHCCYS